MPGVAQLAGSGLPGSTSSRCITSAPPVHAKYLAHAVPSAYQRGKATGTKLQSAFVFNWARLYTVHKLFIDFLGRAVKSAGEIIMTTLTKKIVNWSRVTERAGLKVQ